jgi:hypothetical protein
MQLSLRKATTTLNLNLVMIIELTPMYCMFFVIQLIDDEWDATTLDDVISVISVLYDASIDKFQCKIFDDHSNGRNYSIAKHIEYSEPVYFDAL